MSELSAVLSNFSMWTPEALLGLTFLFILTDRLITKPRLEEKIREAAKWERAYNEEREAHNLTTRAYNDSVNGTLSSLLEGQKVINGLVAGVRKKVEDPG